MNVYDRVLPVGISLKDNSLYMALRIHSQKEIRNWDTCSNLMYGNLLCISIGGDFQNPIWVTVASREMLNKDQIVIVQTCWEWNDMNDAEILLNLITARGKAAFTRVLQFFIDIHTNRQDMEHEIMASVNQQVNCALFNLNLKRKE